MTVSFEATPRVLSFRLLCFASNPIGTAPVMAPASVCDDVRSLADEREPRLYEQARRPANRVPRMEGLGGRCGAYIRRGSAGSRVDWLARLGTTCDPAPARPQDHGHAGGAQQRQREAAWFGDGGDVAA